MKTSDANYGDKKRGGVHPITQPRSLDGAKAPPVSSTLARKTQVRILLMVCMAVASFHCWAEDPLLNGSPFCDAVTVSIGSRPQETIVRFGEPLSVEITPVENQWVENANGRLEILKYRKIIIAFHYGSYSDQYFLIHAVIPYDLFTDNLHQVVSGTVGEMRAKWGEPHEQSSESVRYYCSLTGQEWLDINYTGEKITSLAYTEFLE